MIFDVPAIVEYVSHIVPMLPGDLVFTAHRQGSAWAERRRDTCAPAT
jgi:2-keto-4-pentenoate hydratase/2-oxohepta-3-ene-1,7-dioic acid hydratase in catechol pathway